MPKGQAPKLKGVICNVKVDECDIFNTLPLLADNNGLVIVKLKKKLHYRGHVYFVSVWPSFTFRLVQFLKMNNPLYYDFKIDLSDISDYFIEDNESKIFQNDNSKSAGWDDTLVVDALINS